MLLMTADFLKNYCECVERERKGERGRTRGERKRISTGAG